MLTASRALNLSANAAPELPRINALERLYAMGVRFRQGETVMIAGRSGTQKSGLALWLTASWGLPTLYLSADMSSFTASTRLACMKTGRVTEDVERELAAGGERKEAILDVLRPLPMQFSFGNPITWHGLDNELNAYVEAWDAYPKVIVIDNLMDVEGADSDYTGQMAAMQEFTALARNTGATTMILHHASDKTMKASSDPFSPPGRSEIKGGMSEKPELTLTVALNPNNFQYRIACVKQRMGPSDPTGDSYCTLQCHPEKTQFSPFDFRSTL